MPDRPTERLIADRYALAAPIGQGGMGIVWRARDTVLGREVAIKEVRLPPTIPDRERSSMRARVLREARAAARLNHPNAVTLYDVINEQGHAFIVMELISAPTLAQVVASEGPLDPRRVARIGAGVAGALAAAHNAGIVHRDVKPANVMVLNGAARLTDFGIARAKGDPKLTSTGLIVGSPAYMAPEQATGKAAGPAVDLWGLGATLYYAVEGLAPFDRDGSIATLTAVVNEQPRPPARAGELAPVLTELLKKDPERRPSADALRERLERIASAWPAAAGRTTDTERFPEVHPDGPEGGEEAEDDGAGADRAEGDGTGAEGDGTVVDRAAADGTGADKAGADEETAAAAAVPLVPLVPPVPLGQVAAGVPVELTRPGPSGPGRQRPGQVRPDQPARPARGPKSPPREHPTAVAPDDGGASLFTPAAEREKAAETDRGAGATAGATASATGGSTAAATAASPPASTARQGGADVAGAARGRTPDRRLLIAAVAVLALIAATVTIATVLRNDNGGPASAGGGASATTRANAPTTAKPPGTAGASTTSPAPSTTKPSGGAVPPGWTKVTSQGGAYSLAYPPGWRVSSRSGGFNTIQVSGPGGRLFKAQSSNQPKDPMRAWTELERSFRSRPGYQRIRLEPGTYKGLSSAVWEFTLLEGGQRVHKLDITFKSADGKWGYAVLLQSPERAWNGTQALSSQFERGFTPTG